MPICNHVMRVCALILAACAMPIHAQPSQDGPRIGINLAGGEFEGMEKGQLLPRPSDLQAYYDTGFTGIFRLPIVASEFKNPDALAKVVATVTRSIELGVPIVVDRHESKWRPVAEQIAFWALVSQSLPQSDLIHFGLANEPVGFDDPALTNNWLQWARDTKAIVHGIRAAGITNRIWVQWPMFSGLYRFDKAERPGKACESAACALRRQGAIDDPLKLTGLEAHIYYDWNRSGANAKCAANTRSGFEVMVQKAAPFEMDVLIGEAAFSRDPSCAGIKAITLGELRTMRGLYGVTWWGGGRGWKTDYHYWTPPTANDAFVVQLTGKE